MADSVVRIKLDSQEYESKLKRASEQLNRYADGCRKAGGTLEHVDEGILEFTRSLGKMETTANTARGKLAEMTKAFTEMSVQYKNMTEEEKNGKFGKALNASLNELKGRIQESKVQLDDVSKSLNSGGGLTGALDAVAGKFGLNITQLASWGSALAAAKGVLSVASDAFFASEQNVDEWAGVVAASESVYEGFLTAINNGDVSGFLGRIDLIVKAAREAYNELDRLGTMKTIQAPAMSKQEAENNRMRMMMMTGKYIAPADGRKAAMAEGTLLTPAQIRSIEQKLQNGMKTIVSLTKNELGQTGRAIDAYYKKLAVQNGMSLSEFRQGTSSMAEFDKRVQGAKKYDEWQMAHSYVDQSSGRLIAPRTGNPYAQYAGWNNFRVDKQGQNSYNDLVNLIKQQQQQQSQLYSTMGQTYRTINRAEGVTVRSIMGGGGKGGSKGGGSSKTMTANDFSQFIGKSILGSESLKESDAEKFLSPYQMMLPEIKKHILDIKDADLGGNLAKIGEKKVTDEIAQRTKVLEQQNMAMNMAAQSAQNLGAALAGIENPGAKAAGTVIQAIANVALGFSQAAAQAGSMGPWGWLAYVAAGTGALATTISTIHSLTGYSEGGVVKGNSYSGDNIMFGGDGLYGLNAGEVVLTKAMQGSLAQQLTGNGRGSIQVVGKLHGKDLFICAENWSKSAGHGEFVTW